MTDTKNTLSDERLADTVLTWHYDNPAYFAVAIFPNGERLPVDSLREQSRIETTYKSALQSLRASIPGGVGVNIGEGWETHSLADKQQLQHDAGIPHLPTDMTFEARKAVSGEGPRAYEWSDKKHRLVYDLCREIERLSALDLSPAEPAPLPTRNEEAGFIEFLNYDAPTIVREIDGRCAILLDLNTRQTIGYRVYDPDLSPAEPVALPDRMRMDGAAVKAINFMLGSSDEEDDTPTDAILWVGNLEGDEGKPVHGLHLANAEYPEEGSITLVEFAAPSNPVISDE